MNIDEQKKSAMFTKEELARVIKEAKAYYSTPQAKENIPGAFAENRRHLEILRRSMVTPTSSILEPFTI